MYVIIEVKGKQFKVSEGSVIYTESLGENEGAEVKFKVLAMHDDRDLSVGSPYLDAVANAKILKNGKKKKVTVLKYKAKKNYKRKIGHRQQYSKLEITSIS